MEDAVNMCESTSRMSQPYARFGIQYLNAANVCTTDQMKFTVIVLNVDDSGTDFDDLLFGSSRDEHSSANT